MGEILVIVPSEWTFVEKDILTDKAGYTLQGFVELQGRQMDDLNARLEVSGWFTDERRVVDVLVVNEQLYFKLEIVERY